MFDDKIKKAMLIVSFWMVIVFCLLVFHQSGKAANQWFGSLSVNGPTIDASSYLQINGTSGGFLPPKLTTAQRNALSSPPSGLQIYNTTINDMEVFDGTSFGVIGSTTFLRTVGFQSTAANYSMATTDNYVVGNSTARIIVTLPAISGVNSGHRVSIAKIDTGTTLLEVDGASSDLVCGRSSVALSGQGDSISLFSNGVSWQGLDDTCNRVLTVDIANNGTATITDQDYYWIVSATRSALGTVECVIATGIFSSGPNCAVTCSPGTGNRDCNLNADPGVANVDTKSTTSNDGTPTDVDHHIMCKGDR